MDEAMKKALEDAFLAGVEWQMYNENGTDIEGWEDQFDEWLKTVFPGRTFQR